MSSYARAVEHAEALTALLAPAGVRVVADRRNLTPPCGLLTPPTLTGDVHGGFTADWELALILTGPGWGADEWKTADALLARVSDALTITRAAYDHTDQGQPVLRLSFEEAI